MWIKILVLFLNAFASPLKPGGDLTSFDSSKNAFSHPPVGVQKEIKNQFYVGNSFFKQSWVAAPASTDGRDGLGPTYNAVACASCHVLDGRGAAYLGDKLGVSLLFRFNLEGKEHPHYGGQLNPFAIDGVPAEAKVTHFFMEKLEVYEDGLTVPLKKPVFHFNELAFGSLGRTMISPRIGMQLIGLGLIEAIADFDILFQEDTEDQNKDGISGRVHWVEDKKDGVYKIGRFGWKAEQPTVRQQVAAAFLGDLGITSSLFPQENCPLVQVECGQAISGGQPELDERVLDRVTLYSRYLSVPASRFESVDDYRSGLQAFIQVGCAQCHTPTYKTGTGHGDFSGQDIFPFSDFLLHDMGEELSDFTFNQALLTNDLPLDDIFLAREWRTPPLWGIGLIPKVNGHQQLLHDGRANGVEEAILWHGGEAQVSKNRFKKLSAEQREQIIQFVEKL